MLNMESCEHDKLKQFDALVVEHHARLRAFVRSLGVHPSAVDDIAQEAFLTAYRGWDSYDHQRDFGKWIRGIAAHIVRNEIRKDSRRQRILHEELAAILVKRAEENDWNHSPVSIEALQHCLAQLPPKSQQLVHGRYRDGITSKHLSKRLNITAANVRQSLLRIRRQLKQCVELRIAGETA